MAKHVYTLTLSFRVRPWHNQAEKLCYNKKAGLLYNKNRFSITLFIIYMTKLLQSDWLRGVQLLTIIE